MFGQIVEEHVGCQRYVAVDQADFFAGVGAEFGQFVGTAVVEFVAVDEEGVALLHVDVVEGVERRCGFVEAGAVAVHEHVAFAEHDVAHKHLHVGVARLVKHQAVSFFEKHFSGVVAVSRGYGRPYDAFLGRRG